MFHCGKYTANRSELTERLGRQPTPEDMQKILGGEDRVYMIENVNLRRNIINEHVKIRETFLNMVKGICWTKKIMKDRGRLKIELYRRPPGRDEGEVVTALDRRGCGGAGSSPEPGYLLRATGDEQR